MSIAAVTKKDFQDAIRSRLILAVAVLFVAFTGGGVLLGEALGTIPTEGIVSLLLFVMIGGLSTFVPLVAIGVAYRSIAGEVDTGSLKVLLSLPNSRLDVVVGKFIGRSAVVTLAIVIGFVSMIVAAALTVSGDIQAEVILAVMAAAILLALVFVSIAVSVSAFANSTFIAAVGSFGLWVLFQFAWRGVIYLLRYVVNGFETPDAAAELPEWVEVMFVVNPMTAFSQATRWLVNRVAEGQEASNGADAFYLEPWFGFVVLVFWIVLPLVVGYLKFEASDL